MMRLGTFGIFLSLVLAMAAGTSRAEETCSPVNLYEDAANPLQVMPISHQGETSLCYAYTAAQLTEYVLRKDGQWTGDAHLNPLWIAISYKGGKSRGIRFQRNQLGHGFFQTAFHDMEKLGICDPSVFEAAIHDYKGDSVLSDPDYFFLFEEFWEQRAKSRGLFGKGDIDFEATLKKLEKTADYVNIRTRVFGRMAETRERDPGARFEVELRRIFAVVRDVPEVWIKKKNKMRYLREVVLAGCKGDVLKHPDLPESKSIGLGWATNAKLERAISSQLDTSSPQPVGIGYCAKIYEEDDRSAKRAGSHLKILPRAVKVLANGRCEAHYSLVVGRRPTSSGCQYLVRNTYGRDFWTHRYECFCVNEAGDGYESCRFNPEKPESTDRVLGCWIDRKPLLNSVYDIAVLPPKGGKTFSRLRE